MFCPWLVNGRGEISVEWNLDKYRDEGDASLRIEVAHELYSSWYFDSNVDQLFTKLSAQLMLHHANIQDQLKSELQHVSMTHDDFKQEIRQELDELRSMIWNQPTLVAPILTPAHTIKSKISPPPLSMNKCHNLNGCSSHGACHLESLLLVLLPLR